MLQRNLQKMRCPGTALLKCLNVKVLFQIFYTRPEQHQGAETVKIYPLKRNY